MANEYGKLSAIVKGPGTGFPIGYATRCSVTGTILDACSEAFLAVNGFNGPGSHSRATSQVLPNPTALTNHAAPQWPLGLRPQFLAVLWQGP